MTGMGLLGGAGVAAVAAAAVFLASSPVRTIEHAWRDFKSGYPAATSSSSHFTSGLGNNRYDFWRVALIEFRDHPVGGVGADNFAEDYVQRRRSREEPLFPHSLELRVLAQTGLVGALLFAGFVVAAVWAVAPVFRRTDLAAGVARAGLAATAYWAIHGSIDWFWEFPGLTAPALAWLAVGAGLRPQATSAPKVTQRAPAALRAAGVLAVVLAAAAFTLPWLSERLQLRAADIWRADRAAAFDDLATARRLNPLSPAPDVIDGAIASRLGDLGRMRRAFRRALARDDRQWYAHFELALADASSGRKRQALRELAEAARLNPQEPMVRVVRRTIVAGQALDRSAIDRVFVNRVRVLVGR